MNKEWERWKQYTPEQKVQIAMDMSGGCMRVCADGLGISFPASVRRNLLRSYGKE